MRAFYRRTPNKSPLAPSIVPTSFHLSSYPPLPTASVSSSTLSSSSSFLQARSLDEISAFGYVVVVVAEDASRIGSSFRSFIVRILATISSSLSFL